MSKKDLPQFVKDGLTTDEIREKISTIRKIIDKDGFSESIKESIREEHLEFSERYPMLFDLVVREEFNHNYLDYFLAMRENVIEKKITCEDASKKIGQEWFEKFVDTSKMTKK
jgi:hypothetical protein